MREWITGSFWGSHPCWHSLHSTSTVETWSLTHREVHWWCWFWWSMFSAEPGTCISNTHPWRNQCFLFQTTGLSSRVFSTGFLVPHGDFSVFDKQLWFFTKSGKLFLILHVDYLCSTRDISGEGNGNPLQYSCLENSMDGGPWWATVHEVTKSRTWLSDFTFFISIVPFGEGNGNPRQCSCLENRTDGGAWWATVHGVAKSQTWLSK